MLKSLVYSKIFQNIPKYSKKIQYIPNIPKFFDSLADQGPPDLIWLSLAWPSPEAKESENFGIPCVFFSDILEYV